MSKMKLYIVIVWLTRCDASCMLDFLSHNYSDPTSPVPVPDGNLVEEFAQMERISQMIIDSDSMDGYACIVEANSFMACLDIASHSVLSNSLASEGGDDHIQNPFMGLDVFKDASTNSTNLFGQSIKCSNRTVGDGMINVFDISTVLNYIFGEWKYAELSRFPTDVPTVSQRTQNVCSMGYTRSAYMYQYTQDQCFTERRRLDKIDISYRYEIDTETTDGWSRATLDIRDIALIMEVKFASPLPMIVPVRRESGPPDAFSITYTTKCNASTFCSHCSEITGVFNGGASYGDTIGIRQSSLHHACPFKVHVWFPRNYTIPCIDFVAISDGRRGTSSNTPTCPSSAPVVRATETADDTLPASPNPNGLLYSISTMLFVLFLISLLCILRMNSDLV